uniref:Uncharacterized protein n=1 Tax=Arundo donax TaxID=35708 RepID=A0A0A9FZJ5_ARUDO
MCPWVSIITSKELMHQTISAFKPANCRILFQPSVSHKFPNL